MTLRVVLVVTLLPRARAVAASEPIDPRVRLAISQWPDDAPRGAVSTFRAEHGISRKSFYELRKRAKADGPAAVLEPRSRRPRSSSTQPAAGTWANSSHKIIITDLEGELLAEHTRPAPGTTYVGNGRPPGTRPKSPGVSPKS